MNIVRLHRFIVPKGCNISYQVLHKIASGKAKMSFKTAYMFSESFPVKSLMDWMELSNKLFLEFFEKIIPKQKDSLHSKAWVLKRIRGKYGPYIFKDLKSVKKRPFYTLSWLAARHGFSREMASKMFMSVYGSPYSKIKKDKIRSDDTVCTHNPVRKVADYTKGCNIYKGAVAEKLFMSMCEKLCFETKIRKTHEVDMIVNGFLVDVKSASYEHPGGRGSKIKYFRFSITKTQRELCHFFACYVPPEDCFFIIPNKERGTAFDKERGLYIAKSKSSYYASKNKWHKYKNKFDLLERK